MPPSNKKYVIMNGHFYEAGKPLLGADNRAFSYGDGLFETIRCHKTQPLFFHDHYNRLMRGMAILQLSPAGLPAMVALAALIEKLIVRNRIFTDARVRLSVFRRPGGLYTPVDNSAAFLLEATPLKDKGYQLNPTGYRIGTYSGFPVTLSSLSPFKSLYTTPYIVASLYKSEQDWDDCLIENNHGKIVEATSSNLFWVNQDKLYTPSVTTGCVEGIMRKKVIEFARNHDISLIETSGATRQELLEAKEIFLSNAVNGIRWVVALEDKRYFNRMPKKIVNWLNQLIS